MEREYIRIIKPSPLPNYTPFLRQLDDVFWKKWVFYHLLSFYKNFNSSELKEKIEEEKKKHKSDIEDLIAIYIRNFFRKDRLIELQGFKVVGGVNNDISAKGLYDISFLHSYWNKDFHFECKNLDDSNDLLNKYVCYNTYKKASGNDNIFDGGVLRYFNGKYSQNFNFGGMLGFILNGDTLVIKDKITSKLKENLKTSPEGDLLKISDNSIDQNNFTFDSYHNRFNSEFMLHHVLFNFS